MPATDHYGAVAKLLHWLIAAFVLALIGVGLTMTRIQGDLGLKFQLYQLHKSLGVTVLGLMALRILWRLAIPAPALPATMPAWERGAARAGHLGLYLLLTALPLTGWAMVSTASLPVPTLLYGTVPWPHLPPLDTLPGEHRRTVELVSWTIHRILAWSLIVLLVLHVGAALRHGLLLKDGVMSRMLPRFLTRGHGPAVGLLLAMLTAAWSALGTGSAAAASGPEWSVDPGRSTVRFEASAGGQSVTGMFERFTAEIRFDPDKPESPEIAVRIDMTSARTGTAEIDQALPTAAWFNADVHPVASFSAASARRTGGGHELQGELTIKGVSRPLALPFTLEQDQGEATAKGEIVINRRDFGIGPEEPITGIVIGDDVRILVDIRATRLDN